MKTVEKLETLSSSHQILHAFNIRPNIRFEAQGDNEQVILVVRAHPITQIPWLLNSIIFIVFFYYLNFFLPSFLNLGQIIFINLFALSTISAYIWFNFLSWYFNVGIVTNQRVVDVDLQAIVYREVTYANLNKIEDVTSKGGGFLASIFNYGNVFIQTAGTEVNVEFMDIPRPAEVSRIINNLIYVKKNGYQ